MILDDVCELIVDCPHSTAPDEGIGYPLIRTPNIGKGRFLLEGVHRVSEEVYKQRTKRAIPKDNDIIFAREAPAGNAAIIKNGSRFCLGQRTVLIRPNPNKVNPDYLMYYLLVPEQQHKLLGTAHGATVSHVNIPDIHNMNVDNLPSLETQEKVAEILRAYDDLIENNQKQIKLLEEAAQRLYKEWFIDLRFPGHESTPIVNGLPEEWKKQSIEDIADYLNGFAFKPEDWGTVGKPIIKIKEMNEGITKDTPRNTGESVPEKYNVTSGDILFSWSATLTAMIWDAEPGLLNQHLFKVLPHKGYSREFVLQSILNALEEFKNLTTGATMKHIQRGKLKEVFVLVPSSSIMVQYEKISEQIRQKILCLRNTSYLLSDSRERILPKIMDGTIKI